MSGKNPFLILLLVLALLPPVSFSLAQENLTKEDAARQLEERKRELERTRQQEQTLSRDLDALAKERATLNEQLIATASRIQASEKKLSEIEERLGQYSEQETMVRGSIEQRRATIAKLLGAMQRIGKEPPPAVVARRDDALEMVRSAMLMASIYPELKFQADSLGDDLKDLVRLTDGIRREQAAERQESAKLEQEQFRIAGLLEEKKSRLARGQTELAQVRDAAKRHASEVTYLGDLLERMTKELAKAKSGFAQYEKEQAELRRRQAEQQTAPASKPEKKKRLALLSPGRIKPGLPFAKTKGTLPRPVQGQLLVSFGDTQRVGGRSQGIWLETRKKAQVISPTDGWIVYAGEFRSYGQLLIIDAGGGYHVLLAGMNRIDVEVGQFVLAGEPVSLMGTSASDEGPKSGQGRPVLYVEFRKNSRPINPAPWWTKLPEKVQG